ncbi:hypothetical protein SAMN00790413_05793 [Deinococcus hopiensis KR-140]|uniref:Uncharacterized protein n=1 Tax=Deinococcus hopiensis KR-140 TaxID=695939 RepID=A0A1W1UDG6_9DEIO|nr:hypothetical protein SAMN00790413_05793 [Deinococcus hopiensis KR-140]
MKGVAKKCKSSNGFTETYTVDIALKPGWNMVHFIETYNQDKKAPGSKYSILSAEGGNQYEGSWVVTK